LEKFDGACSSMNSLMAQRTAGRSGSLDPNYGLVSMLSALFNLRPVPVDRASQHTHTM